MAVGSGIVWGAMGVRGDGITSDVLKRWVMRLLVMTFVVRALIPLGYMPDASAAAKGVFKVVICSALGVKTMTLDANGQPVPAQHDDQQHDQPCAFSGLAAVALAMPDVATLILPERVETGVIAPHAVNLPPARAGPALGSRGPPLIS